MLKSVASCQLPGLNTYYLLNSVLVKSNPIKNANVNLRTL
jgi:hypothetical protein